MEVAALKYRNPLQFLPRVLLPAKMLSLFLAIIAQVAAGQHSPGDNTPITGEGFDVGNGGDIILCSEPGSASFDVLSANPFSLDFLMFSPGGFNEEAVSENFPMAEDYFEAVAQKLRTINRPLAGHFENFIADLFSNRLMNRHVWVPSRHELIDVSDEQMLSSLPEECIERSGPDGEKHIKLRQAIIRIANASGSAVNYYFEEDFVLNLRINAPWQFSYLIVHEWLWDFFDPREIHFLRSFNRFLHSDDFFDIGSADFFEIIQRFDFPAAFHVIEDKSPDQIRNVPLFTKNSICRYLNGYPACDYSNFNDTFRLKLDHIVKTVSTRDFACSLIIEPGMQSGEIKCFGPYADSFANYNRDLMERHDIVELYSDSDKMICVKDTRRIFSCHTTRSEVEHMVQFQTGYGNVPADQLIFKKGYFCTVNQGLPFCWAKFSSQREVIDEIYATLDFKPDAKYLSDGNTMCSFWRGDLKCVLNQYSNDYFREFYDKNKDKKLNDIDLGLNGVCYQARGESIACDWKRDYVPLFRLPPIMDPVRNLVMPTNNLCFQQIEEPACFGNDVFLELYHSIY